MSNTVEGRVVEACSDPEDPTITFRYAGSTIRYYWWLSEDENRRLTVAERRHLERLLDVGRLRRVHGWQHGRGYVEKAP